MHIQLIPQININIQYVFVLNTQNLDWKKGVDVIADLYMENVYMKQIESISLSDIIGVSDQFGFEDIKNFLCRVCLFFAESYMSGGC